MVADNQIAVDAGSQILKEGNAFDAAVTTALILGITHPHSSGIGGGGFVVFKNDNAIGSLDFREMAPSSFYPEVFIDGRNSRSGVWSVGVPGELAGLFELHKGRGALSWSEVVLPFALKDRLSFPHEFSLQSESIGLHEVPTNLHSHPFLNRLL